MTNAALSNLFAFDLDPSHDSRPGTWVPPLIMQFSRSELVDMHLTIRSRIAQGRVFLKYRHSVLGYTSVTEACRSSHTGISYLHSAYCLTASGLHVEQASHKVTLSNLYVCRCSSDRCCTCVTLDVSPTCLPLHEDRSPPPSQHLLSSG